MRLTDIHILPSELSCTKAVHSNRSHQFSHSINAYVATIRPQLQDKSPLMHCLCPARSPRSSLSLTSCLLVLHRSLWLPRRTASVCRTSPMFTCFTSSCLARITQTGSLGWATRNKTKCVLTGWVQWRKSLHLFVLIYQLNLQRKFNKI